MKSNLCVFLCAALTVAFAIAQTPAARVTGTITAVDAAAKTITVKQDSGEPLTLTVIANSHVEHQAPGEKATPIELSAVTVGDRFVASIQKSADQKVTEIRTIVVLTSADINAIHAKELQDWKTRGTTGNLASTDPASKSFTMKVGSKDWKVVTTDKTAYQRYSPDSGKISDAKASSFAELKTGDEVHVLGNKNADNTEITAEQIVAGSFPQIAATIKSINAAAHEMVVTDLATKKPVTIKIDSDSTMKKLPDMAAQMLARLYGAARGGGPGGDAAGGGRRGGGGGPPGAGGPPGGRGRGGRGDVSSMLDQAPAITLADLKAGDAIMVKTTPGSTGGAGTAVFLLAGVEPILTAAPNSTRDIMSGWNLGGGGGGGEGN